MNFCTLFDSNYLSRGLTMYKSLMAHCPSFNLYIICLDDKLFKHFSENKLPNIIAISLSDIEDYYPELVVAKSNRSYVEYIFTLSPVIPLYLLNRFPEIELITSMDADIYFFSDPSVLLCDSDSFSIAITPHRFKSGLKFKAKYGIYNVSFQSFKNNKIGLECLGKWKEECLNWCYDKIELSRYADQKYLDKWMKIYPDDVKEYKKGSGVAPWNIRNKDIELDENGNILFRGEPLIYYHFHGVRNLSENLLSIGLVEYLVLCRKKIIKLVYHKYIKELSHQSALINNNGDQIKRGMKLKLGKQFFFLFFADLYKYENDKLTHVVNLNFFQYLNTVLKSAIKSF